MSRRRHVGLVALVALAAGCGGSSNGLHVEGTATTAVSVSAPESTPPKSSPAPQGARCDPRAGCIHRRVPIGSGGAIAYDAGTLWVAAQPSPGLYGTLLAIDTQTGERIGSPTPLPSSASPYRLAVGDRGVWVGGTAHLWLIDPRSGTPQAVVNVPGVVTGMVIADGGVWGVAATPHGGVLLEADATTGAVLRRRGLPAAPTAITVANGSAWIADAVHQRILRLSTASLRLRAVKPLPKRSDRWQPKQLTVTDGVLWVYDGAAVLGLSARTGALRYTQQVVPAAGGGDMAAGPGQLWVASMRTKPSVGTVLRLDPRTGNQIGHAVELGGEVRALATGGGALWALDARTGTLFEVEPGAG